jgi:hypothetical protein
MWVLGLPVWSWCLCLKHFTDWAISSDPNIFSVYSWRISNMNTMCFGQIHLLPPAEISIPGGKCYKPRGQRVLSSSTKLTLLLTWKIKMTFVGFSPMKCRDWFSRNKWLTPNSRESLAKPPLQYLLALALWFLVCTPCKGQSSQVLIGLLHSSDRQWRTTNKNTDQAENNRKASSGYKD